jgi:hypothetical protein
MEEEGLKVYVVNGIKILNTTPHSIAFLTVNNKIVDVERSGKIINADYHYTYSHTNHLGLDLYTVSVEQEPEDYEWLVAFHSKNPDVVIVGSQIAARAYPGLVYAMMYAPGYNHRTRSEDKVHRTDRWII